MNTLSVEQQIAALRPTLGFAARFHLWLLAGAGIAVAGAIVFWHPVPLMIAAFLAIVGFSEQRAGPNIVAAIRAFDSGTPGQGSVTVSITCWDTDNHYHATVSAPGHPDWQYEFMPQGWKPEAQSYPARIWRSGGGGPPLLAVVDGGVLIPRNDPRQVDGGGENRTAA